MSWILLRCCQGWASLAHASGDIQAVPCPPGYPHAPTAGCSAPSATPLGSWTAVCPATAAPRGDAGDAGPTGCCKWIIIRSN